MLTSWDKNLKLPNKVRLLLLLKIFIFWNASSSYNFFIENGFCLKNRCELVESRVWNYQIKLDFYFFLRVLSFCFVDSLYIFMDLQVRLDNLTLGNKIY